ncbi:MAG: type IV pilus assembly protein PilM [Patescibacteria group bacterium]|nr:type IV pilus assembly protein PilM [Patescibacteria group bacterium]
MKNKLFGLDIGTTTMKAVWLDKVGTGYSLNSVYTMPTPARGMMSESPLDQEEVAQTITRIVEEAHISSRAVNLSLPESQVFTRIIDMPILSDKELSSAIYWEAEQYIPVPLNSITLDYRVLHRPEPTESATKMTVLLVGAPTMLIDKYDHVLSLAGISIASLETEILSIIRSVIIGDQHPPTLVANIGAMNTSLAIVRNNMVAFTYSIATGGIALSRSIAADFGFSFQQAEEYKKAYGLVEGELGGKIGKATAPVLASILTEVRKAFAFYNEKFPTDPVQQIILSGGTAKLPGLNTFFANNSGIETVVANPWKVLNSQEVPEEILNDAPEYALAVGLAMREYE